MRVYFEAAHRPFLISLAGIERARSGLVVLVRAKRNGDVPEERVLGFRIFGGRRVRIHRRRVPAAGINLRPQVIEFALDLNPVSCDQHRLQAVSAFP
ncbi:hypothetical protein K9U33_04965 [Rhodoblastus acidophilus]|uniref:Uncharacterized protein n=1 Tax=Candidatus Rhodoblastus alkanivorans TaxID=2954117 RepID=A0ABS9Z8E8_9HYPH|nr:hypothetical protein [Candidatus Rhodoblastus alkanivorans]MCI4678004.1 hypothetical protein [Candidatus Rhodoblastus alkanivorans]MCI4683899.1 hypothetical protein [Candidatus Rhodoblastus alkanivorans]